MKPDSNRSEPVAIAFALVFCMVICGAFVFGIWQTDALGLGIQVTVTVIYVGLVIASAVLIKDTRWE